MSATVSKTGGYVRGFRGSLVTAAALLFLALANGAGAQADPTKGPMEAPAGMSLDRTVRTFLAAELLEFQPGGQGRPIRFDGLGWIGGDYNRIWLRAEGDRPTSESTWEAQGEVLYGRLVSPFWNAVGGVRVDARARNGDRASRALLAVGFEGLAPYWFVVEPTLYVSQNGDVSARFTSTFDVLLTQRLIVQPRVELNAAVQSVPRFGVGSGINDSEIGARVRYEIRRELAPYVGLSWRRRYGGTAGFARSAGEAVTDGVLSMGVRLWR